MYLSKLWILTLLTLTIGCGSVLDVRHWFKDTQVDEVLKAPMAEFLEGCSDHVSSQTCSERWNSVVSVKGVDGYVDGIEGRVGICNTKWQPMIGGKFAFRREIKIMTSFNGKPLSDWQIRQVVFHEAAHCILHIRHDEVRLVRTNKPWLSRKDERNMEALKQELWEFARANKR